MENMTIVEGRALRPFSWLTCLLVLLFFVGGCTITNQYGPYYGKVVDAETKAPLEGAAVLIVFYTISATMGGAVYHYADAIETVTDKNGEFRVEAKRLVRTGILQRWDEYGHLTIFKPGYGCYPNHKDVKPMFVPNGTMPEKYNVTFELPGLETKEERSKNIECFPLSVPDKKMRKIIALNNLEADSLGLEPTHLEKSK